MKNLSYRWIVLCVILLPQPLFGLPSFITFPSDIDWQVRSSDHFQVLFRKGQEDLSTVVLTKAEKNYQKLVPFFPEAPSSTWIVLADFQDSTNGYALTFPYPHIVLFISPPDSTGQLSPLDDWLETLILHEYTHILHLYPASGLYSAMRAVFGSWVVPNGMMPTHFHEGMATFMETLLTKGGRGRGTLFSMYRRMAIEANKWNFNDLPEDRMDGAASVWPHGTSAYFFGYYFTEQLWLLEGKRGIFKITDKFSGNFPYYINTALNDVFGYSHSQIWKKYFNNGLQTQLSELKRHPQSALEHYTQGKFYKSDVTLSPDANRVAYRAASPDTFPRIVIREVASKNLLDEIEVPEGHTEGLCWGKFQDREYFITARPVRSRGYSINHLFAYDVQARRWINLGFSHVHRLSCSPNLSQIMIYQELATQGEVKELRLIACTGRKGVQIVRKWDLPIRGMWVSSLLSGKEHWIAVREGLSTSLWKWRRGKGPIRIRDLPYHVYGLRESDTDGEILAITTKDGRDEIWRIPVDPPKEIRKIAALIGGTNSFDRNGKDLYLTFYEHGGYDVARTDVGNYSSTPLPIEVPSVAPQDQKTINENIHVSEPHSYTAWSTIFPRAWVPTLLFVPGGLQVGAWIPAFDIAQKHFVDLIGGYDTRGLFFADLSYTYRLPWYVDATLNGYIYPQYFSGLNVLQKNWGGSISLFGDYGVLPVKLRLSLKYNRIEATPLNLENQSIGPEIGLSYTTEFRKRPLDIAPISGMAITASFAKYLTSMGSTSDYYSAALGFQKYFKVPLFERHVLSTNLKLGFTEGASLFISNFQAGGENIFSQGRGSYMNRGFDPLSLVSRRMFNANVDYLFPIATIDRGINLWPFFLKNIHAAFTFDATSIGSGISELRVFQRDDWFTDWFLSAGGELRSDWTLFSYLPTQIRAGLYHGFGDEGKNIYFVFGVDAALSF